MADAGATISPVSTPPSQGKKAMFAAVALLITVLLLIYGGSAWRNQFVNWDDEGQLYQNPDFNPATVSSVLKYWTTPHMNLYMPVSYTLWGAVATVARVPADAQGIALNPVWFHGLNLLLHI